MSNASEGEPGEQSSELSASEERQRSSSWSADCLHVGTAKTTCDIVMSELENITRKKRSILVGMREVSQSLDLGSLQLSNPNKREEFVKTLFSNQVGRETVAWKPTKEDEEEGLSATSSKEEETSSGHSEPDWSTFETSYAKDLLPNPAGQAKTKEFLHELVTMLLDYVRKNNDRSRKVLDFHHPNVLHEMMDHCLDLDVDPQPLEQILSDCKETLKYCVRTGHPRFFNQLSTGLDVIALAGEWLTSTANTNMFTYEIAPVFTLLESLCLEKMRLLVGWHSGDGIFTPGGAIANMYAMIAARFRTMPSVKQKGLHGLPQLVLYVSEHSHYSFAKAASVLGLGSENVIPVKVDARGRMIPEALDAEIQKSLSRGHKPFFAVATAGTTVLGAYDPIPLVYTITEKHGIWLHVDAAWGGGALLSARHRHLLTGIEYADSVTWNPHKMMGVTLQCSAFLTKHKDLLTNCNSTCAEYLFQKDKNYEVDYDTGDKSIQCGRHNDVFKLWLMWRAKGDSGFEDQIDKIFDNAEYLRRKLRERDGFEFVLEQAECTNVCFWYVPRNMRHLERGRERDNRLGKVAPRIKGLMMETGCTMVGYQPLDELPNFFRMVFSNPATNHEDIDFLVDTIEKFGEQI